MKTYKVIDNLKYYRKYDNQQLRIRGGDKEFNIIFDKKGIPHLLGLQYLSETQNKANKFTENIIKNRISDETIVKNVRKLHGNFKSKNVKNRIDTFDDFMKNLENSIIVTKTKESSKIGVNYLLIQKKEEEIRHLGLSTQNDGAKLEDYQNLSEEDLSIIKSYFIEDNYKYFKHSSIFQEIDSIEVYNEKTNEYEYFSFDDEKQKKLDRINEMKTDEKVSYKQALGVDVKEKESNEWLKDENIKDWSR